MHPDQGGADGVRWQALDCMQFAPIPSRTSPPMSSESCTRGVNLLASSCANASVPEPSATAPADAGGAV